MTEHPLRLARVSRCCSPLSLRCRGSCGGRRLRRRQGLANSGCDAGHLALEADQLAVAGDLFALTYVSPQPASLSWGALGGAAGIVGLVLFYRALSAGAMSVVAPVTAVTAAAVPVAVGLATGDDTTGLRLLGVVFALVAIALVSLSPPRPGEVRVVSAPLLAMAIGSGMGFAVFFVCLGRTGQVAGGTTGLWPVVASQLAGLLIGGAVLATPRRGRWPHSIALRWTLVAGTFDMKANALYLVASRNGELSVVAPLAALGPVSTVILALIVDHERMRRVQVLGFGMAVLALILVDR